MLHYKEPTQFSALCRVSCAALKRVPLFLLSFMLLASGFAQSSGSIRGTVKNQANGKLLANALVTIEGTGKTTYTDEYGVYRFSGVASGEYTVRASYVGVGAGNVTIAVDSGVSSGADIVLKSSRYSAANFRAGAAAFTSASTWLSNLAKFLLNMSTRDRAVLS